MKAAGVASVGAIAGCLGGGDDDGTIQIGAPVSETGGFDYLQEGATKVLDMTVDQINEAGGPLDREIELLTRDTAESAQEAREVVDQLITVDDTEAILGLFSTEIAPNYDYLQSQEVPVVTYFPGSRFLDIRGGDNGTPEDTSDDEWIWRTIIGDTIHTTGQAVNARELGYNQLGLVNTAVEGERSWMQGFKDAVNAIDELEIANEVEVEEGASSYQTGLNRLFSEDIDALVMAFAIEDAVTLINDYDAAGYDSAILMSDGLQHQDLVDQVGDIIPEENYAALGGASGPHLDQLRSDFDDEYGTDNMGSDNHPWAIAAYDSLVTIALAIHRAGEYDATAIQQNIRPVTSPDSGTQVTTFEEGKDALDNGDEINFDGAMSEVDFDDKGNVAADTAILSVTPDGWIQRDPIEADAIEAVLESDAYESSAQ